MLHSDSPIVGSRQQVFVRPGHLPVAAGLQLMVVVRTFRGCCQAARRRGVDAGSIDVGGLSHHASAVEHEVRQ